jgi:hypothetical protein
MKRPAGPRPLRALGDLWLHRRLVNRLRFVEEFQIWLVSKQARTSLPGDLFENPQLLKSGHKSVGGREGDFDPRRHVVDVDEWPAEQLRQEAQPVCSGFFESNAAVAFPQGVDPLGGLCRFCSGCRDSSEEEAEPSFPISRNPYRREAVVVLQAVKLEVEAQVEKRRPQNLAKDKQECDQEPSDTSIPIEKGVDGFELRVD